MDSVRTADPETDFRANANNERMIYNGSNYFRHG